MMSREAGASLGSPQAEPGGDHVTRSYVYPQTFQQQPSFGLYDVAKEILEWINGCSLSIPLIAAEIRSEARSKDVPWCSGSAREKEYLQTACTVQLEFFWGFFAAKAHQGPNNRLNWLGYFDR